MKKVLLKVLLAIVAVCLLATGLIACSNGGWNGTTMTNWGEGNMIGGFVGEKGNYVYYINGNAQADGDNAYGTPVKGALMAMDKNDTSKTEVVVPHLFVSSDYNAGVYIYGDYVYYATPSTDKDSTGAVAYTDMIITKTKLDGSQTEKLFLMKGRSTEFRVVEVDGEIFVVYYDSEDLALKEYSVKDDKAVVIASSDVETENMIALDSYQFGKNGDEVQVAFTVKVYTEKYYEDKSERATANYNQVYIYKAGSTAEEGAQVLGEKILDGNGTDTTYALNFVKNNRLFYNTTKDTIVKNYFYDFASGKSQIIDNASVVSDAVIFFGDNTAYYNEDGKVKKTIIYNYEEKVNEGTAEEKTILHTYNTDTSVVAVVLDMNTLVAIEGGYAYYYNTASNIVRIKLGDVNAETERVSEDTVTTTWYKPQFVTIGTDTYIFYCDNTSVGSSYVKYVNVSNANVESEDTDDDGVDNLFYLTGHKFAGVITDLDAANIVSNKITAITGKYVDGALPYETNDEGKLFVEVVDQAKADYDALSKDAKELVSESSLEQLEKYIKAVELANLYSQLSDIRKDTLSETEKQDLETIYNSIKAEIEEFIESEDYTSISALIGKNRLWYYQKAVSLFDAE